jgi:hypothetical protein
MPLYNTSELLEVIKSDIGIKDVPLPVDDKELLRRFELSTLREFSVRYPVIREVWVTSDDVVDMSQRSTSGSLTYVIPEKFWQGTEILDVLGLLPGGYGSEANMYMPNVVLGSADMLIESIADIKMAASLGQMMTHAPTHRFDPPDRVTVFNGWASGSYRVELALRHDLSLATIPAGAFTNLRQLAVLDMKSYLYKKMKRLTNLDTGIGSIDLKIDDWESAEREMQDLLRDWDDTVELGLGRINYF